MPPSTQHSLLCHHRYDALDRLVDSTTAAQSAIRRFYCNSRLASEIQGAVQRSIIQHDDHLLAQAQREGTSTDTTLLATDPQRSVINALDTAQSHPVAYAAYGHHPAEKGLRSLLAFNGERPDPVTGHYPLGQGYRQYNPLLKRFNSPDSWSPFGEGGLNAYAYCKGNPVNRSDPTGHMTFLSFYSMIMFAGGAAHGVAAYFIEDKFVSKTFAAVAAIYLTVGTISAAGSLGRYIGRGPRPIRRNSIPLQPMGGRSANSTGASSAPIPVRPPVTSRSTATAATATPTPTPTTTTTTTTTTTAVTTTPTAPTNPLPSKAQTSAGNFTPSAPPAPAPNSTNTLSSLPGHNTVVAAREDIRGPIPFRKNS
ncbi:RHS repeat-associated core domain-containing protein [Pseudomonas sp. PDM31]|uniref:RHS repeat-associated core domain-containing protein n=1 Tax=Pseudomonas sp. PDM31 TaxID=2854778 RepID=UPI001C4721D9|nr:RHS repeat-associated core domain-containing protein [Pseudomonas sp. PDM31]MBV7481053.1 RHS repeat-associated core domain-containing protein [Pseudomonas sp. PDM31]